MYAPSSTPRDRPYLHEPSWTDVATAYAAVLAIPVALWAGSNPLAAGGALLTVFGLHVAYRRVLGRLRRLYGRRRLTVTFGETVRITVTQAPVDECC